MITSEQINEVVEKIVINVNPDKIYLFGSYANGKPTVDSDLDLLVIKDTDAPIYKRNTEVKKYLRGMKIPLDLFVYTPSEVNQLRNSKTAFVNQILEKGSSYMENRNNLVKEWISKAEQDVGMAKLALDYKPEYTDAICFHCQQAVEKYLKVFLTYLNIDFKKSHSLSYLLDLIAEKEKITEELYAKADQLESYAVKIRYPVEWPEPSIEEATEAYNHVLYFKKMFLEQMGLNEEI